MESFDWKTEDAKLLPDGEYCLQVSEPEGRMSKRGDPQVTYTPLVVGGEYHGFVLPKQYVTFLRPPNAGAGIAIKFLKSIGQPYQGEYKVVPADWDTKRFKGFVTTREYNGSKENTVKWVDTWEGDTPAVPEPSLPLGNEGMEEVPF